MIRLVPASAAHVGRLANRMREIDQREVIAMGMGPKQALRVALAGSVWSLTVMIDDFPHAMFGVSPISAWKGRPWFLGSDEIYRHGREMLTMGARAVEQMLVSFSKLENVVSKENERAIRLLKRWGFEVEAEVLEIGDMAFHRFYRQRGGA